MGMILYPTDDDIQELSEIEVNITWREIESEWSGLKLYYARKHLYPLYRRIQLWNMKKLEPLKINETVLG